MYSLDVIAHWFNETFKLSHYDTVWILTTDAHIAATDPPPGEGWPWPYGHDKVLDIHADQRTVFLGLYHVPVQQGEREVVEIDIFNTFSS